MRKLLVLLFILAVYISYGQIPTTTTPFWAAYPQLQAVKLTNTVTPHSTTLAKVSQFNDPYQGNQKGYKVDWIGVGSDTTTTAGYVIVYATDTTGAVATITPLGYIPFSAVTMNTTTTPPTNYFTTTAQQQTFITYPLLLRAGQNVYVGTTVAASGGNIIVTGQFEYY